MGNGQQRKKKLRKIHAERFRLHSPACKYVENGVMCRQPLYGTLHHFFCNKHWKIVQVKKQDPSVKLKKVYVGNSQIRI